jgi:dTMP kinase
MLYVAIDGPGGCGKSTQSAWLIAQLQAQEIPVLHVREPGGTYYGEAIRHILMTKPGDETKLATVSELLLFMAARYQLLTEKVIPALAEGTVVISDRCLASSWAYQVHAQQLPAVIFADVARHAIPRYPDLTLLLNVPAAEALRRRRQANRNDRYDLGVAFYERVCAGYLSYQPAHGQLSVLDGQQPVHVVAQSIWQQVNARLPSKAKV